MLKLNSNNFKLWIADLKREIEFYPSSNSVLIFMRYAYDVSWIERKPCQPVCRRIEHRHTDFYLSDSIKLMDNKVLSTPVSTLAKQPLCSLKSSTSSLKAILTTFTARNANPRGRYAPLHQIGFWVKCLLEVSRRHLRRSIKRYYWRGKYAVLRN